MWTFGEKIQVPKQNCINILLYKGKQKRSALPDKANFWYSMSSHEGVKPLIYIFENFASKHTLSIAIRKLE